jgi:hypothetical protein
MRVETFIIVIKALVVCGTATISALVGALSQWSNDTASPSKIQWVIIIGTALGAGGTALGGFLSSSFGKYLQNRNGNGATAVPEPKPVTPTTVTP